MKNIVIFGPPGSGKGTQSDKIIHEFNVAHISTGEVLRAEIAKKTELGILAKKLIDDGQLVPDTVITDILDQKLDELDNDKGIIFDGYPRTTEQACALKQLLNKRNTDISAMICLEVEKDELIQRLLKRGKACGRSDDNLATIEKRINIYHEKTAPVKEYYKKEGTYYPVNGMGSVDEIFKGIADILHKLNK